MSSEHPTHPASLSSWSANFLTRLHRYKMLLRRRWWILALTISFCVCYEAYQISQETPSYQSEARMMVSGRFNIPEGSLYNEETSNFIGTQIELMTTKIRIERMRIDLLKLIGVVVSKGVCREPRAARSSPY